MPNQNNSDNPSPIFPQADLPPLPPSFQDIPPASGSNGSAAPTETTPPNLPPVISGSPKKKFGGGRIIATILGILLLVGGVGAGFVLTQQQQLFSQKARVIAECVSNSDCPSGKVCKNSFCVAPSATAPPLTPRPETPAPTTAPTPGPITDKCFVSTTQTFDCGNGGSYVPVGKACTIRPDFGGGTGTCQIVGYLNKQPECECKSGVTTPTPPPGGGACRRLPSTPNLNSSSITITQAMVDACKNTCSDGTLYANKYTCSGINLAGGCQDNGQGQSTSLGNTISVGTLSCGTVQIDIGCKNNANTWGSVAFTSKSASQACSTSSTPGPGPLAQCLSVKAYSSTWTLLTSAQLSTLTPGTSVNFCVAGTSSSGSFDKAKFTINGVAQAETTTKRPSSEDYCQSYGVPTGVSSFNISAQIHHATLGWSL